MDLNQLLINIHNETEHYKDQASHIIEKYTIGNSNYSKAFFNMCDKSINAFPKETADKNAVTDYNNWYKCQQKIFTNGTKSKIIGLLINGLSWLEAISECGYKADTSEQDIFGFSIL